MENKITKKKSFLNDTFLFSILSVALGLLVGAIALILSGHNPITVYAALIDGIIGKPKYIAWTIIRAAFPAGNKAVFPPCRSCYASRLFLVHP